MNWLSRFLGRRRSTASRCTNRSSPPDLHRLVPLVEELEARVVPARTITAAFGAGYGGGPQVTVLFDDGNLTSFLAFPAPFTGGVSVVLGHVNGHAVPDVIVGAGIGGGPEVKVFDGQQLLAGQAVATADFFAFDGNFRNGVVLAAGRVNGTTHSDVVVGAGRGSPSAVSVFDGAALSQGRPVATATFEAFTPAFLGGVSLAVGPVNATGHADLVIGAGPGGGPQVLVIDGANLAEGRAVATANFLALPASFTGGVIVTTGAVNGTSHDDVVVGAQSGGGPQVTVYDGAALTRGQVSITASFAAFSPLFTGGVTLATGDIYGSGHADVVVGAGPGGGPQVAVFDGNDLARGHAVATAGFFPFAPTFPGGVQVLITHQPGHSRGTLIVAAGRGGGPAVLVYNDLALSNAFYALPPSFLGGINFNYEFVNYGNCHCSLPYFVQPLEFFPLPVSGPPGRPVHGGGGGTPATGAGGFTNGGFGAGFGGFTNAGFTGAMNNGNPGFTAGGGGGGGDFTGGGTAGCCEGGFTGGGDTGGGCTGCGGTGGGDGGSLRAASASLAGLGSKGHGSGAYLSQGQLSLKHVHVVGSKAPAGRNGPSPGPGAPLSQGALHWALDEAFTWWVQAGINPFEQAEIKDALLIVGSPGRGKLGHTTGNVITLSPTAVGYGWYVDAYFGSFGPGGAPIQTAAAGSPAAGSMDLATVLAHEMGHILGLRDNASMQGDIMDPFLTPGTRWLPTAQDVARLP
jgi:hypothetical protein